MHWNINKPIYIEAIKKNKQTYPIGSCLISKIILDIERSKTTSES